MTNLGWLLEDIEDSPDGPEVGAFFDFDGTLIDGYSAKAYFVERLKSRDIGLSELITTMMEAAKVERRGDDISRLVETAVGGLAGRTQEELDAIGEDLFRTKIAGMVFPGARALIEAHMAKGHTVVIASSATPPQILPTARDLGITEVLATQLRTDADGALTGEIDGPILWGEGKASAVEGFATDRGVDLSQSFAYSNGTEDLPFLSLVGRPRPLNPDKSLARIAGERGWPVSELFHPKSIGPVDVARSLAAYGALGFGLAIGIGTAISDRSRRAGANAAAGIGSDLALTLGGIELNVEGRENLWRARPAVFLFNHQSQLDVVILGSLLREDFTGVAKVEASHNPLFAPIGYLADIAYIDRSNNTAARQALAPVVTALKNGRSIAIAPEGTRSVTDRILPFKKGPFHIAMQAKVPIVPIVIRNAGELMRPHALFMAPGRLDVKVLEPIDTSEWTTAGLDTHIAEVRQRYLDAMVSWNTSQE
jgi:putative phosphoserine phosphatase / 1-acylglycerol-3-phosphate O-acyltransferase